MAGFEAAMSRPAACCCGAIDESTGVVSVGLATGPAPDSKLSSAYFQHGTTGTQELIHHYARQTGGVTRISRNLAVARDLAATPAGTTGRGHRLRWTIALAISSAIASARPSTGQQE